MNHKTRRSEFRPVPVRHPRGFALIVTLSLMILLTVIAVGLLSLSTISLRSSSQGDAMQTARANARMAVMLAVGDLQKQLGPDTRISARADILNQSNASLLGAWQSWQGTDHDATGRPVSPGDYPSQKKDRFLGWLVSGNPGNLTDSGNLPPTTASSTRVPLVGIQTLPSGAPANLQIHLDPVLINHTRKGAYAWWVGGENQKALLPIPESPTLAKTNADWVNAMKSSAIADTKPFGLESLRTDPTPANKAITLKQTDFITQAGTTRVSRQNFHDLSTFSVGLLTNTATGGWRKDLSLFTEKFETLPASGLPLFRLTPEKDSSQSKATASEPLAAGSMLYPWSGYRSTGSMPYEKSGAVASWANLADYARMYRQFGTGNSFAMSSSPFTSLGDTFKHLHTVKLMPIVARLQWVYAYALTNTGGTVPQDRVTVKLTPVVTLWNPYNVTLNVGKLVFTVSKQSTMPLGFDYQVVYTDGVVVKGAGYRGLTGNGVYPGVQPSAVQPQFVVNSVGAMPPGGTKVFSITGNNANTLIGRTLEAGPGFSPNNGHFIQISSDATGNQIYSPRARGGADRAKTVRTKVKMNNAINTGTLKDKFGLRLVVREDASVTAGGTDRLDGSNGNEMVYQMTVPSASASSDEISLPDISVSSISTNGYPFLSLAFGLRAIDNLHEPGDPHDKNKLAKGFVQTSPTATYSDLTVYPATANRVNAAYDFNMIVHSATDDVVPNTGGAAATGYMLTGLTVGTGLARLIASDIPVKPLASLGELQGWDMRFGNPAPPYSYNVIGNSDATPLIPSNSVDLGGGSTTNLQHDDSYCANHVLFDDWFFSSINQGNPAQFGGGGSLKANYTNFLRGTAPLANSSYQPTGDDAAQDSGSQADALFTQAVDPTDSWRKIASHLEVKGMFNVNSTSVTAWKALLGHARNQQVPRYGASAVSLDPKTDYPVTRYSVAGDVKADSNSQGTAGNGRADTSQYTGYRVFTEQMINDLAEKIVDQVRKRGPFLSLSEFVNRQLSDDKDLAVAGAIQTALNQMESTVNGGIDSARANGDAAASGYKFAEAAAGSSAHGMPGWVRQADILRPLAPILSARDDTFTVRGFGDARDASGKVTATAYCEAIVRRTRNYCDSMEAADLADPPNASINKTFGRKFEIVSFRWLSKSEI